MTLAISIDTVLGSRVSRKTWWLAGIMARQKSGDRQLIKWSFGAAMAWISELALLGLRAVECLHPQLRPRYIESTSWAAQPLCFYRWLWTYAALVPVSVMLYSPPSTEKVLTYCFGNRSPALPTFSPLKAAFISIRPQNRAFSSVIQSRCPRVAIGSSLGRDQCQICHSDQSITAVKPFLLLSDQSALVMNALSHFLEWVCQHQLVLECSEWPGLSLAPALSVAFSSRLKYSFSFHWEDRVGYVSGRQV